MGLLEVWYPTPVYPHVEDVHAGLKKRFGSGKECKTLKENEAFGRLQDHGGSERTLHQINR